MPNYDFIFNGGINLDTRRAQYATYQLQADLNNLLQNTSINIKTDSIVKANKEILNLQQNLRAALNPKGTLDLGMFTSQLDKNGQNLTQYAASLSNLGKQGQQAFLSLTNAMSAAEAPTTRLSQGMKNVGEQLKRTIGWQLSSSAIHGVMSTYSQAIGYAKELNRSLTDIRIVTGQSQAQMANFAKSANIAAKNLSSTTTRYTDAALIYYQQGLSDKAVKERTDVTIKMANAAGVSAAKASQQLTAIWNNFDNGTKSLEHYADVLVKLGAETASSSDEISKGVQKFAAIGNTVGLSYEYAASALATVTATTRESADTVGTSFRTLFSRLQGLSLGATLEDGTTLNKYSKALNTIGVRIKETNGDMKSMNTILDEIGSKWGTLSKDTQIGLAQSIGGARQYSTFMALMDNWDYFQENVDRANNSAGALQKQQDIYAEGWEAASKRVQSSMEGIFDSMIDDKAVIKMTNAFSTALTGVEGLMDGFGGLRGMLVSTASIFGMKYAKEMPRILDDLKHNLNYTFSPKRYNADIQKRFNEASSGLNVLASRIDSKGFGDPYTVKAKEFKNNEGKVISRMDEYETKQLTHDYLNGTDEVLKARINIEQSNLERQQRYLLEERNMSQREKESFQQQTLIKEQWNRTYLDKAVQLQQAIDQSKSIGIDVAKENFNSFLDERSSFSRSSGGKRYNLLNENERNKYYADQRARIDTKYNTMVAPQGVDQERFARQIARRREKELIDLAAQEQEIIQRVGEYAPGGRFAVQHNGQFDLLASTNNKDRQAMFVQEAFKGQEDLYKQVASWIGNPDTKITATRQREYIEFQTMLQKPVLEISSSFGKLENASDKLKNIFEGNAKTIGENDDSFKDLQKNLQEFSEGDNSFQKIFGSYADTYKKITGRNTFSDAEGRSFEKIFNDKFKDVLEGNLTGSKFYDATTKQFNAEAFMKEFSDFQNNMKYGYEKVGETYKALGANQDQLDSIVSEGINLGKTGADLDDYVKAQMEQNFGAIKNQREISKDITEIASGTLMTLNTIQNSIHAYDTFASEDATGLEKFTAGIGLATDAAMTYSVLKDIKGIKGVTGKQALGKGVALGKSAIGGIKNAGGAVLTAAKTGGAKAAGTAIAGGAKAAVAGAGTALGSIPVAGWIALAAIAAPLIAKGVADNTESKEEKDARIETEVLSAKDRAQQAIQDQRVLDQALSNYDQNWQKVNLAEKGSIEQTKAITQANADTLELIEKYNLSQSNGDYTRDENGFISINQASLDRIESQTNKEAINAQTRSIAASLLDSNNKATVAQKDTDKELKNLNVKDFFEFDEDRTNEIQHEREQLLLQQEQKDTVAKNDFYNLLTNIGTSDGKLSEEESNAIKYLTTTYNKENTQKTLDEIERKYGGPVTGFGSKSLAKREKLAKEVFGDEYEALISSEKYTSLTTDEERKRYLMEVTKTKALSDQYATEIQKKAEQIGKLDKKYTDLSNTTLGEISNIISSPWRDESDKLGSEFAESQLNKVIYDLGQAVDTYTNAGLNSDSFNNLMNNLTLDQAQVMGQSLQSAGDLFGKDASQSIYDAVIKAEGQDRNSLIRALKQTDFNSGTIQALADLKKELGDIGNKELFEQIKSDFGGDKGIFTDLLKDDTVGKVVEKFQQLGEINATDILEAAHSSAELAQGLELANFNAAGFAMALEGVASGTISQDQVSNPLLDVLSNMGGVQSNIAEAYDSLDNFEIDRSITTLGKGYGKIAKQMNQSLNQGIYLDDPLLQGWEKFFGKESMQNYIDKITEWNKNGGVSKKDFDAEFGDEIKTLKQVQKTGNLLPVWMQALDDAERRQTITKEKDGTTTYSTGGDKVKEFIDAGEDGKEGTADDNVVTWASYYFNKMQELENNGKKDSAEWHALNAAYNNQVAQDNASKEFGQKYIVQDGIVYNADYNKDTGKSTIAQIKGEDGKLVDDALFGYDPTTGKISTFAPDGVALEDSKFAEQFDTFEKFEEVMKNIIPDEGMRQAAIADWTERNPGVTQLWEENGISGDFFKQYFGDEATEEDKNKLITREELEVIFNNSKSLQGKYGQLDAWIAEGLMGSSYGDAFKDRYMNFNGVKVAGAKYSELSEGYKQANGKDANLAQKIAEKAGAYTDDTDGIQKVNMDDVNKVTAGLGFSTETQTEVLNQLLAQETALVATVSDIDGNTKTISTNSADYQQWLETSKAGAEASAENFQEFINGQNSQSDQLKNMVAQQRAQLEYDKAVASGAFNEKTGVWDQEKWNELKAKEEQWGKAQVNEKTGKLEFVDAEGRIVDAQGRVIQEAPAAGSGDEGVSPGRQPQTGNENDEEEGSTTTSTSNNTSNSNRRPGGLLGFVDNVVGNKDGAFGSAYNDARDNGKGVGTAIIAGVTNGIGSVVEKIGEGIGNVAGWISDKIAGKAVGQNQHKIKVGYSSGKRNDGYEGLARVGEEGQELRVKKNGDTELLGTKGETYAYVEKDDIIFTADQTKDILRNTPNLKHIPGFLIGQNNSLPAGIHATSSGYGNIWDSGKKSGGSSGGAQEDDWEPDRYVVIMEQLQDLQREYERLNKAKERAYGADKIKALDAEIAKTNELLKAQQQYIKEIEAYREKDLQKMKDLGIDVEKEMIFDRNGVIRNFDEIEEKYKKAAEEGDQEAAKKFEAIQKFVETNNLLQEASDALIDIQWQLLDEAIERIKTKVDIKVAVDDTELSYLSYQLGKINEQAYDVAKALDIVGQQMSVTLNKINPLRQGIEETLLKGLEGTSLTEEAKKELANAIMDGTITAEQLEQMALDENISASVMETILSYREQILGLNTSLDQLKTQVVNLTEKHFTKFNKKMKDQDAVLSYYQKTLNNYYNIIELLDRNFDGPMTETLSKINDQLQKHAIDSIKRSAQAVAMAEEQYNIMKQRYEEAVAKGDQDFIDLYKDKMENAYGKLIATQQAYTQDVEAQLQSLLNSYNKTIKQAFTDFERQISPLFGTIEALSSAFERQSDLNNQYVDDYQKYYELNKLTRDLQSAIDETDNINSKKALSKLQEEINKEKATENKLSEHDLEVLKNKVELEQARLALDEAKNAKSTVTLSRDQNGNWGYVYTAEEDKVAKAEQEYEDKLHQYQESNKKYIDELQEMILEAKQEMQEAALALDPSDANFEENLKHIIDTYNQKVQYFKEQLNNTFEYQEESRIAALDAYSLSMIDLNNNFSDLALGMVTNQQSLEQYFNTLETSLPKLLSEILKAENAYTDGVNKIKDEVTQGEESISDYINKDIDSIIIKTEEANNKMNEIYKDMVNDLQKVNEEISEIYDKYIDPINEMVAANEKLAESLQKVQQKLSDLSEVETPPILEGEKFEHPEGYTENDYGVIRKLTEDEIKLREEVKKEIQANDKGVITNYDALKEQWYREPPAEGEEDTRDEKLIAKWDLLQKLIDFGVYSIPDTAKILETASAIINSNAAAMESAAVATAATVNTDTGTTIEQNVTVYAEFPSATDQNEIAAAFDNITNDAAQYANRRS